VALTPAQIDHLQRVAVDKSMCGPMDDMSPVEHRAWQALREALQETQATIQADADKAAKAPRATCERCGREGLAMTKRKNAVPHKCPHGHTCLRYGCGACRKARISEGTE
jgi:hypothetical protein